MRLKASLSMFGLLDFWSFCCLWHVGHINVYPGGLDETYFLTAIMHICILSTDKLEFKGPVISKSMQLWRRRRYIRNKLGPDSDD